MLGLEGIFGICAKLWVPIKVDTKGGIFEDWKIIDIGPIEGMTWDGVAFFALVFSRFGGYVFVDINVVVAKGGGSKGGGRYAKENRDE